MAERPSVPERLAQLAYQMLYPELFPDPKTAHFAAVTRAMQDLWDSADRQLRLRLQRVRLDLANPVRDNGPELRNFLLRWLARRPVRESPLPDEAAASSNAGELAWEGVPEKVRHALARSALGLPSGSDEHDVEVWRRASAIEGGLRNDEEKIDMTATETGTTGSEQARPESPIYQGEYDYDPRGLPPEFDPAEFKRVIYRLFKDRNADPESNPLNRGHAAYVAGSLLLASYYEPESPGFEAAFVAEFDEGFERVETVGGRQRWRRLDAYVRVAAEIHRLKGGGASSPTVQEVSAVSDEVIDRGPVDDNFVAKVRSAHDDFVANTPFYDSLDLPDIVTDDTAQAEVEPANIRSVGMIYAASELESTQLIAACDQAAQDWLEGVVPMTENAGRLFDAYVWTARDRLDPAARQIQYDRIGDLSAYLLRFCSATSERDRAQYLSEYLSPADHRPSAQPRDAAVRKTARDLLAYASLHGWAYAQFAAKRLGNQIRECVAIIEHPEVQKAYGVQGPWPVVERIAGMTSGMVPEISKHRTLASTGKAIVDMLATKATDIAASLAKDPLFPPRVQGNGQRSVFSQAEYETLINLVESWLAANTVNDRERFDAAQPTEISGSPSLPMFGPGAIGSGGNGFDSEAVKNQLMQMVSAGQMPTADQVQQFFNAGS